MRRLSPLSILFVAVLVFGVSWFTRAEDPAAPVFVLGYPSQQLWLLNKATGARYSIGTPEEALEVFRLVAEKVPLGDLRKIPMGYGEPAAKAAPADFLRADGDDRFWYVNPRDDRRYYFDGSKYSYDFLRQAASIRPDEEVAMTPEVKLNAAEQVCVMGDMKCITEAARLCRPARVDREMEMKLGKVVGHGHFLYKVQGLREGLCSVYLRHEAYVQDEVADAVAQEAGYRLGGMVGRGGFCYVRPSSAADFFEALDQEGRGLIVDKSEDGAWRVELPGGEGCAGPLFDWQYKPDTGRRDEAAAE